ncbi:putative guanosine-3'5'-bis 3'-pyrophosphohydrolase protein [Marine Group I thaumarchaeote SCGC RSA3]|uniref:Guanosine-3'5'-bis 3'-pyrophosphohydrolase protein n=2 Tax=Marine Group I TaxID=905826 RepID=A0A081RP04_9ARCH|nr:Guanosine-3'5'-bis 3'-pyrophosphohydrolase protein [Marine Group I thaumarchaeote SCGC AAA799-N04]KFM17407.1 putative guanosine-3'5'-bis 3'-pyrophosphohydrolase protein [Marine Group I thaumarchaeote SCGC RSA3]
MSKVDFAESFARDKHKGQFRKDKETPYFTHLEAVVSRLKSLGVADEDVLSAGWLHDTIEDTETTFDDIEQRFGQKVAVLVLSLSKDESLPKKDKELQYTKQLKEASFEGKLVKLCDISANLKDLDNSKLSKTKKKKTVNKKLHYLRIIKNELAEHITEYPKISSLIDGINQIAKENHQRPIVI